MKRAVAKRALGWLASVSAACLLLTTAGCGGEGVPRAAISGHVTLDGQPLEEGGILFTPLAAGPSASASIEQGKYEISQADGPGPGEYRVQIRAYRSTGKQITDPASGIAEEQRVSIIPPRYNSRSTLTAQITDQGPNEFDFELKSK